MRLKKAVVLCILMGVINLIGLFLLSTLPEKRTVKAENGILSLEQWDMEEKGNIILRGEWELYPGVIITPQKERDVFVEYSGLQRIVDIGNKNYQDIVSGYPLGSGTLRLVIKLGEDGLYGINAGNLQENTTIYMNGIRGGRNYEVKRNGEEAQQLYLSPEGIGQSKNRQMELVIQFRNVRPGELGKIPSINFGIFDRIVKIRDFNISIEMFTVSCFFILGILFLWNYIFNKKHKYALFLSLFLLLETLHTLGEGERLIFLILPNPKNMLLFYEYQIQLFYLSTFCFMMTVYYLLHSYMSKKAVIFLSSLLLVIGPIFNWELFGINKIPEITLQHHKLIISAILVITSIYIFIVMIKSLIKGVEGPEYVLVFSFSFLYYVLVQIIGFIININTQKISIFMFLIMIISITLYMNYRFQLTHIQVEHLSQQLIQKDWDKDQFLVRTSRELKKPVYDIMNSSKELLTETANPTIRKHREQLLKVNLESRHVNSILEELMEVFGEQTKNVEYFPESVDETDFMELLTEINPLLQESGSIDIRRRMPEEFPTFLADREKLKEILYCLLHNAVKFAYPGEIEVRIDAVENMAHITVKDTGIGIDRAQLGTIFTAFYQEHREQEQTEGLGLGLTIAKKLIELQGGVIWIVSEPGKGSAFTFSLPLAAPGETEQVQNDGFATRKDKEVTPARKKRKPVQEDRNKMPLSGREVILVVEGTLPVAEGTRLLEEVLEYPVETVESGEEALEYINRNQVDLVLTDLVLSDMSGYDLCLALRKKYNSSELPIIVLDETGRTRDMQRAFQSGASDFLLKPVVPEELKVRIEARLLEKISAEGVVMKELQNLHTQIMPHFLYNTLNTIIGLSYKDTEKTCEALQHLSTYFRAKLDFSAYHSFVSLDREIELMKAYLAIEKMRYNERLEVIYDIDESIRFMIPTLTLQPLVENAVQHGINGNNDTITIRISIQKNLDSGYLIKISDNGPGIPEEKQQELLAGEYHRIGFSNVVKKVRLLKDSGIWLDSSENSGTCITIYIPKEVSIGGLESRRWRENSPGGSKEENRL